MGIIFSGVLTSNEFCCSQQQPSCVMNQRTVQNLAGTSSSSATGAHQYHNHVFNMSDYSRGGGGGYASVADGVNDLLEDYQVYHTSATLSLIRRKEDLMDPEQLTLDLIKTESSTPHTPGSWDWGSNR